MKHFITSMIVINMFVTISTQAITLNCKTPHNGAKHRMYRANPYEGQKPGYFNIAPVDSHVLWDQFEVMCEVKNDKLKGQNKQYAVMNLLGVGPGFNFDAAYMEYKLYCPLVSNIATISKKVLLGVGINASALLSTRIGVYSTVNSPIHAKCVLAGIGAALIGAGISVNALTILPVSPKNVIND